MSSLEPWNMLSLHTQENHVHNGGNPRILAMGMLNYTNACKVCVNFFGHTHFGYHAPYLTVYCEVWSPSL